MKNLSLLLIAGLFLLLTVACEREEEEEDMMMNPIDPVPCMQVTFSEVILPLFQQTCGGRSCHGAGSTKSFELTNYAQTKVYVNNGTIEHTVLTAQTMPPSAPLTSEELGKVKCWLDAGAPDN